MCSPVRENFRGAVPRSGFIIAPMPYVFRRSDSVLIPGQRYDNPNRALGAIVAHAPQELPATKANESL